MALELHYNVYGCFRDPGADVELAADAVDAGFGGIWTGDHFLPWIDSRDHAPHAWSWLGTLLNEVPDVPVGTSVTCPKSDIDVHWAGWGPQSCRAAGQYADHLLTVASPELVSEQIVPHFETGLDRAGRTRALAEISTEMAANVGDPDALVDEIRERGEYIPDESELDNPDPRRTQAVADERLAELTDEEVRAANNITDDPAAIVDTLEAFETKILPRFES
jgi:alkanesulfonate monooxygenase SsuD/methylene tetrahydromethanopterin reductase-like flavin-dependent oxidoreductase (luciferase family)